MKNTEKVYDRECFLSKISGPLIYVLFCVSIIVLSIILKMKDILRVLPTYLKLLWNGHYVLIMFGFALIYLLVRIIIKHDTIGDIFDSEKVFYWLGIGFILAGIKLFFDMDFVMTWLCEVPLVIGIVILFFVRWFMTDYKRKGV